MIQVNNHAAIPVAMLRRKQTAFTLIEILIVLGIIGLALALVPPVLNRALPGAQVQSAVRHLMAGLKTARIEAISTKQDTALILDVENFTYATGENDRKLTLPGETKMVLTTARSEQLTEHSGAIRFFPDGSSAGGRIEVGYGNSGYLIDVNWLTGKVTVSP